MSETSNIKDGVNAAIESVKADVDFISENIPERVWLMLAPKLTERLRERFYEIDDEYVSQLEQEIGRLSTDLEQAQSTGYSELKNEIALHENVIKHLLYLWNDGEPTMLKKPRIQEMETVDLAMRDHGEEIKFICEEQD